ncbi:MAG: rRNA pseudouridine synthase [Bacteroidetes bacterium]|nr:MAG: rRNA pseudouridine synthase [Bacteroidota bacterium]
MKRKTDNFNKFFNKKRNSAVKEEFRQEKKAARKEKQLAIEKRFEEKRKQRSGASAATVRQTSIEEKTELIPVNKFIAHSGICSRRDAAELVKQGKVTINGKIVTEPATRVSSKDLIKVNDKKVNPSRHFVYILLNKPKDYITTTDDPQGRKTVLDLIKKATSERVYPVGRLDRNTSGVLLLTNDGDLAQKLAHPKHEIRKVYHVVLDKPLTKAHFDKIVEGVELEDGKAEIDALAYADAKDKTQVGLEIHSGKNRIVRRIFEQLGYDVKNLDRVMYAGLTKKNVNRGNWRLLTEKEIRILKYLNSSLK